MCSWCWAFRPVWTAVQKALPDALQVKHLLGGLAPDSDVPMLAETQTMIRRHWQTIEQRVPGTEFNFKFWTECAPLRSTYPACRAVIAAKLQDPQLEDAMILAIQQAYYLQVRNPSCDDVLIDLAAGLSLDSEQFRYDLNSSTTQNLLMQEIQRAQNMGAQSFPSLVLEKDGAYHAISIDYNHAEIMTLSIRNIWDYS